MKNTIIQNTGPKKILVHKMTKQFIFTYNVYTPCQKRRQKYILDNDLKLFLNSQLLR